MHMALAMPMESGPGVRVRAEPGAGATSDEKIEIVTSDPASRIYAEIEYPIRSDLPSDRLA